MKSTDAMHVRLRRMLERPSALTAVKLAIFLSDPAQTHVFLIRRFQLMNEHNEKLPYSMGTEKLRIQAE